MFILTAVVLASLLSFTSALDRNSVAEQSAITDEFEQCLDYNFPPVANDIPNFPKVFEKAKILAKDTEAKAKFDAIAKKIPNIAPKTQNSINTYDGAKDPDCWWTSTQCTTSKHKDVPSDIDLVPEPQTLGYGFDDGPNCSNNAFYDHLTQQKQKATMFFIGSNVLARPLQAKRALDDGHEICVHSWSHPQMTTLSNEDAFAEIYYTVQAIKLVTGATPTCFRPPFGDIDDRIRAISAGLGLRNILWKFDTNDATPGKSGVVEKAEVQKNYDDFIKKANDGVFSKGGAILLAHETNNLTMQLAVDNYDKLRAAFKHIVPIAVAFNLTTPFAEPDFKFPNFEQYIKTEGATGDSTTPISRVASFTSSTASSTSRASLTTSRATSATGAPITAGTTSAASPTATAGSGSSTEGTSASSTEGNSGSSSGNTTGGANGAESNGSSNSGSSDGGYEGVSRPGKDNNNGKPASPGPATSTSTASPQNTEVAPGSVGGINTANNSNGASVVRSTTLSIVPLLFVVLGLAL